MINHCIRALYIQISWMPPFDCCETSPVNIYCIKKETDIPVFWDRWLTSVSQEDEEYLFCLVFSCESNSLDGLEMVERLVQGHAHKLRSKSGSWTREFWPPWLENKNLLLMLFSFLHPCLYVQWITRSQKSFVLGVGWVKKWSAWWEFCVTVNY